MDTRMDNGYSQIPPRSMALLHPPNGWGSRGPGLGPHQAPVFGPSPSSHPSLPPVPSRHSFLENKPHPFLLGHHHGSTGVPGSHTSQSHAQSNANSNLLHHSGPPSYGSSAFGSYLGHHPLGMRPGGVSSSGGGSLFSPPHHPPPSSSAATSLSSSSSSFHSESFTQALFNLSKVQAPPRNSLASSSPVTSVTSSQVLKRESGSAFSAPPKSSISSPSPYLSAPPPHPPLPKDVSSDGEEAEVLVDDFDGQCCRTYPLNHSRILAWRKERKRESKSHSSLAPPSNKGKSRSSREDSSSSLRTVPLSSSSPTSSISAPLAASNPNSAIPVGIAIGRQRQLHEKPSGPSETSKRSSEPPSSLVSRASSTAERQPSSLLHPSLGMSPWAGASSSPLTPGTHWPMDPFNNHHPSWPHHPHMGPIPMGYQLAKDPLTGQILLIPTDGIGPPRPNPHMWGPFESGGASHHGPPPYHPPGPYPIHHNQSQHQLYLQTQFSNYMRTLPPAAIHHHQSSPIPTSQHKLRSIVPETINLGSSSDEEDESKSSKDKEEKDTTKKKEQSNDHDSSPSSSSSRPKSPDNPLDKKQEEQEDHAKPGEDLLLQKPKHPEVDDLLPTSDSTPELSLSVTNNKLEEVKAEVELNPPSPKVVVNGNIPIKEEVKELTEPLIRIKSEIIPEEEAEEEEVDIKVDDSFIIEDGPPDSAVVEALLSLGSEISLGFDSLICALEESIPTLEEKETSFELLLRAVKGDSLSHGLPSFFSDAYILDVDLLCTVTADDYAAALAGDPDPWSELRSKFDLHTHRHPQRSAEFITNRIKKAEAAKYEGENKFEGMKSLAAVIKKIKNTEIMSQLEVELRGALVQIQSSYKEKQRELTRLKARSPKKKKKRGDNFIKRPPGRPKKRKLLESPSVSRAPSKHVEYDEKTDSSENETDEESDDEDHPPILQPVSIPPTSSSLLLKPPTLTASSSAVSNPVTNLSTIKARFMRGKENPFANLMKLATTPSSSKPGSEGEEEVKGGGSSLEEDDEGCDLPQQTPICDPIKKRKSDNPQKHSASTETLVTKKPKNLFMMNHLNYPSSFSEERDEYEFEDDDEELDQETKKIVPPEQPPVDVVVKEEKQESSKNEEVLSSPSSKAVKIASSKRKIPPLRLPGNDLRSAKLTADDLKDGLRLLMLNDGRFWPARLNSTRLPDVYGVVMEKQRGNRPQILPRDDILQECIMEVKPESKDQIPPGTRVCVYWSSAYNCLFPGTVESTDSLIQVELDDGDTRDVVIGNVRMLPYNYSHVFHDPDPIATLRKRRQSSDSTEGKDHKPVGLMTPSKSEVLKCPSSPEVLTSSSSPGCSKGPTKKHKHKHKHHRCKKHHKKHHHHHKKPPKLDGTFNNTTTYSIRSPPVYSNSSRVTNMDHSRVVSSGGSLPNIGSNHEEEEEEDVDSDEFDETENKAIIEHGSPGEEEEEFEDGSSSDDQSSYPQMSFFKSKASSSQFNLVTGRPLWTWGDEGYRRPGSKGKAKKLFHRSICRESEVLNVGDCAVFLSMAQVDRPYIGRIDTFWETWNSGHMMVKVKWFYHPEEIETSETNMVDLKVPGGLFQSPHMDENEVQTISHKCSVIPFKDFLASRSSLSEKRKKNSNTYYLAGNYEPGTFAVQCFPGVLKS